MNEIKLEPNFFKIKQLKEKIGLKGILASQKDIIVTFNQLMKRNEHPKYIFIFDEKSIETYCLVTYCNYFNIEMYKLAEDEILEVKSLIKYAQIVCISKSMTENKHFRIPETASNDCVDIFNEISNIDLNQR